MLDLRRTQPAKRKILRLTGLFPQNGSKFHFGNDDNCFFHKGNGVFFPETIQKPSRCPQVWEDRVCQGLRLNWYVHTCFYTLPYTFMIFRCTTEVQRPCCNRSKAIALFLLRLTIKTMIKEEVYLKSGSSVKSLLPDL